MMTEIKEPLSISFLLKQIRTLEFSISNHFNQNSFDTSLVKFRVSLGYEFNADSDLLGIQTTVEVFTDNSERLKICHLITLITFQVADLGKIFNSSESGITVPDILMHTFLSLAISTTRGILTAKTEGTVLHESYMPVIDLKQFLSQTDTQKGS